METGRVIYWVDGVNDPKEALPERKKEDTVFWCKDYASFVKNTATFGAPDSVWLDGNFEDGSDSKACADFLVDYCLSNAVALPEYNYQTDGEGCESVTSLFESYNKFYKENIENE